MATQHIYGSVTYDGERHPAIYCRRCSKPLDTHEQNVGWCRSCDLVESVRVFGTASVAAQGEGRGK